MSRHRRHRRLPGDHRPRRAPARCGTGCACWSPSISPPASIPDRSVIFAHSLVPALNQLMLPFLSLVTDAELHRNPTVKAESLASRRSLSALLLTYPVHQAADILGLRGTLVPVGRDQLPHIELTRLIARRFNDRYGAVFAEPEALLSGDPAVLGIDGAKMSKTRGNTIPLGATEDETAAIIRAARSDGAAAHHLRPRRPAAGGEPADHRGGADRE